MSLRTKLLIYIAAVHVPFALVAYYAFQYDKLLVLAVEAMFVVSLAYGVALVRGLFGAIERIREGAHFLADGDFTSKFREVGHPEMDRLVHIYNRMADNLREERIRNQEQNFFLEKLLAASPFGVVTFDYDGNVSSVSPGAERLLRVREEDLVGTRLEGATGADVAALRELDGETARVVPMSGNRRVKLERGEFLDRGFPRAFIVLSELTDELRRSEKEAYEKVIRMMSHEVNNTVAATTSILHSCLSYHERNGERDEDYVDGLRAVIGRTDRLNDFMRGFADVVRLPDPRLAPCDLAATAESVVSLMRESAASRGVRLCRRIEPGFPRVLADRIQIEQVIVNVVKNAIEAIDGDGSVTVRLERSGDDALVIVEDTGPGVPPDLRDRLFTPFFTTKQGGHGIGLTLVQEILTRHGAQFSLDSPPGEPTRFTIRFNRAETDAASHDPA